MAFLLKRFFFSSFLVLFVVGLFAQQSTNVLTLISNLNDKTFDKTLDEHKRKASSFNISNLSELVEINSSLIEKEIPNSKAVALFDLIYSSCNTCDQEVTNAIIAMKSLNQAISTFNSNAPDHIKLDSLNIALKHFEKADNFYKKGMQSLCYHIGMIYYKNSDYYKSKQYFQKSQKYANEFCVFCNLYEVWSDIELGKYDGLSKKIDLVAQDEFISNSLLWKNNLLLTRSKLYSGLGDSISARNQFDLVAPEFIEKWSSVYYSKLASFYKAFSDHENASKYYLIALSAAEKEKYLYPNTINESLALGSSLLSSQKTNEAKNYLQAALEQCYEVAGDSKIILDEVNYISVLLKLARVHLLENDFDEANQKLENAKELISKRFSNLEFYTDKISLLDNFATLVSIFHQYKNDLGISNLDLLMLSEDSKSYALFDEIKMNQDIAAQLSDESYKQLKSKQFEISEIDVQIKSSFNHKIPRLDTIASLTKQKNNLSVDVEKILANVKTLSEGNFKPLSSLINTFSSDQTILHYFLTEEKITSYIINKGKIQTFEIPLTNELSNAIGNLSLTISQHDQVVSRGSSNFKITEGNYVEDAKFIFNQIIEPVLPQLRQKILIIPHGILSTVPFEALITNKDQFLIQNHNINYAYSLRILEEMYNKGKTAKGFLGFAPSYEQLNPLPYVAKELAAVENAFSAPVSYYSEQATKEKFLEEHEEYSIIHIASHADINPYDNDYSYIAFTDENKEEIDYLLYLNQLYNINLNTDMIVLSACNTGIGKYSPSEGILSIARGFVRAGTSSVISTLWEIDDHASSQIMEVFYKELSKGQTKDEALANAKRKYIRLSTDKRKHPYYWAGFVALGNMDALEINNEIPSSIALGLLLLFLVAIYLVRKKGIRLF